jgi:hypothetical protein
MKCDIKILELKGRMWDKIGVEKNFWDLRRIRDGKIFCEEKFWKKFGITSSQLW